MIDFYKSVKLVSNPQTESPEDIQRIVDTVIESTAKIIVVFSSDVDFSPLLLELLRHNVTNRTWIASEAWITSALINQPEVWSWVRVLRVIGVNGVIGVVGLEEFSPNTCSCSRPGGVTVGWDTWLRCEEGGHP